MPAYAAMARRSWRESALPCTLASLGDAVITLGIYGVGALAAGRLRWGLSRRWNAYAAVALLGLIWAVAVEGAALASGRWSYTERMPIVPGLGIGLWPLLQLALLTPAALGITGWWSRAKSQAH